MSARKGLFNERTYFAVRKVGMEDEILQSGKRLKNTEKTKYEVYRVQCEENLRYKHTRHIQEVRKNQRHDLSHV